MVVAVLPHDGTAFTQGLAFWQGRLFEGTGLYGRSVLRELDPRSGQELRQKPLGGKYFGEGITILNGRVYQLTWREETCLVYDATSLERLDELSYDGEGWGLTNDGSSLIMSDGSDLLYYRDPTTLNVTRTIRVRLGRHAVNRLNEIEYVRGQIWANVWHSDIILRISPADGHVVAVVDASNILPDSHRSDDSEDVLNGIAFDESSGRLLITGKRWPQIVEIELAR